MQCPKCKHQEIDGSRFCTNCGENLENIKNEKPIINFCPGCGTQRENDANFCKSCGYNFSEQNAASPERYMTTSTSTPSAPLDPFNQQPYDPYRLSADVEKPYASFGRRVLATIIDGVILFAFAFVFIMVFLIDSYYLEAKAELWGLIIGLIYKAGMESSSIQGTLGKKAVGIKVTDLEGNRISFLRAIGRFFASYLSGAILAIGYLMAAFTDKRQTLHDMIAGTVVKKYK